MAYLLDTNIISYLLKATASEKLQANMRKFDNKPNHFFMSSISYAELLFGIEKVGRPQKIVFALNEFLKRCQIIEWDKECAVSYAMLRSNLSMKGITVQSMDLMIGAHAHAHGLTLISNDHIFEHFKQYSVTVENWQS